MRRLVATLAAVACVVCSSAAPASAEFGLSEVEVAFTEADGSAASQAGSHPFAMSTSFELNTEERKGVKVVQGALRDLEVVLPEGMAGNPTAVPRCATIDFLQQDGGSKTNCADSTAVGFITGSLGGGLGIPGPFGPYPIHNLQPSPAVAAKLGFWISDVPVTINVGVEPESPYNVVAWLSNTSQLVEVFDSTTTLWGNPADPTHDADRGACAIETVKGTCPANIPPRPFLTLPRSCEEPLKTIFTATSWWTGDPFEPGPPSSFEEGVLSPAMSGCTKLGFGPQMSARPTTQSAESASGLDLEFEVEDEGLTNPQGVAHSDVRDLVLTLPEGMTLNASAAEGQAACSLRQLEGETFSSAPGEGCPRAAEVGSVEVETPILEEKLLRGAMFIATQDDPTTPQAGAENPFDSLLALYVVIKHSELGLLFKVAGEVRPDPRTGQLIAIFDELPPYPIGRLRTRLREGGRAPLVSPPRCGPHAVKADLTPSGAPANSLVVTDSFQILRGVDGGPCPLGVQPFEPGFLAGSLNDTAGSFAPFHMRLTRRDGDQDLTRFDATLPPGVLAKLASVASCSDPAIAAAKAKTGRAELASPSCPASAQIGTAWGGAGVGSQLTYVPGKLYLAGPFGGAPLSVVGIVPAVAGPFDVGTVVVRQALQVDPRTGVASVDGARSDPIPHILAGIPLRVRDIRVEVDRPQFTLNPTDCSPFATVAQIWGGGTDFFSTADDSPVSRTSRFQAADCAHLRFKPRMSFALDGGTARGSHPALETVYRPRAGDANLAGAVVRLPRSAFLDQAHIRTICTRVQFAADTCPEGAIYGRATARTPLLSEPLSGPVYLRSSDNELPDVILDLHGLVDVEVALRIDSIRGGIRATVQNAPDAPLTKAVIAMQGGRKGLIVNSRNLCAGVSRAKARLGAQNGRRRLLRPVVRPQGCKKRHRD